MPSPATLAGGAAALKHLASGGKKAHIPGKRRQKRIVISEKQWEFIRELIRATSRGSTHLPRFKRKHRRQKPFF